MNGLALCAGIGGLELGIKLVCSSYTTICYVEREAYNVACLVKRMEEGFLDKAPVWDDLATFDGKSWRGTVDLVTAGFPCQPFSAAGKQLQERDPRHLWPEIARIVGEVEPALVFLENVSMRAFREPFRDLQRMGFEVSDPYACTAAELGAGHLRRRVFVLAYRNSKGLERHARFDLPQEGKGRVREVVALSSNSPEQPQRKQTVKAYSEPIKGKPRQEPTCSDWWSSEPRLERLVYGVSCRVERDRALGNAVVPIMAAKAFSELMK